MSCHMLDTPLLPEPEYDSDNNDSHLERGEIAPLLGESRVCQWIQDRSVTSPRYHLDYSPDAILSPCTSTCSSPSSRSESSSFPQSIPEIDTNPKDLHSGFGTSELIPESAPGNCFPRQPCIGSVDDERPSTSYALEEPIKVSKRSRRWHPRPSTPLPMPLSRVIKLAASFFFIYSAMNSISEYVTSLLPDNLGDQSLFLLQTTLCASTLAAPGIVSVLGELRAMMFGGITHVIYLAVLMQPSRSFVLAASALCGFGASGSWVAQGTYLSRYSPQEKRGLFSGVFWGIYYISDVVGNLTAYTLFKSISQNAMFAMGTCSAILGVLLLILMEERDVSQRPKPRLESTEENLSGEETLSFGTCERCGNPPKVEVLQICSGASWENLMLFILMTPMIFYAGCESAFWTAEYSKLLPTKAIGLVLFCTGLGQFLGSILLGWLSDFFRCQTPTFLVGVLASITGLLACVPLKNAAEEHESLEPQLLDTPIIAFLGAFCFGVADGVITTHTYALTGRIFPGRKPEVWAIYNLLSNGGAASTYWIGMIFPVVQGGVPVQLWIQVIILTMGTPLYIIVDIWSAGQTVVHMQMLRWRRAPNQSHVQQDLS